MDRAQAHDLVDGVRQSSRWYHAVSSQRSNLRPDLAHRPEVLEAARLVEGDARPVGQRDQGERDVHPVGAQPRDQRVVERLAEAAAAGGLRREVDRRLAGQPVPRPGAVRRGVGEADHRAVGLGHQEVVAGLGARRAGAASSSSPGRIEVVSELELAISATTRHRRKGEEDRREYYFLADGEFAKRVAEGDFLEHVTYVSGQRYDTLRSEIGRIADAGHVAVLELETEGALKVAEEIPHAVTIFVTAPVTELERRLRERATESAGEIGERLDLAESQLRQADLFDHVVENDEVERAVSELATIVGGYVGPARMSGQ